MKRFALTLTAYFVTHSVLAQQTFEPNVFECKGTNLQATINPETPDGGQSRLHIVIVNQEGVRFEHSLLGEDLTVEASSMGTFIGTTINQVPDLSWEEIRILLPEVNLSSDRPLSQFDTIAIRSLHRTSIAGPRILTGALSNSSAIPVKCQAYKQP